MSETASSKIVSTRVRVFVDFWNYTLSMKTHDQEFSTDWSCLGDVLAKKAAALVAGSGAVCAYQGMNVYLSYAKRGDGPLKAWATNKLDTFAGVHVFLFERQRKKSPPSCPTCHEPVNECPCCQADMRGTEEKGVDTRIVTDMMQLAWADNYDVAVLVSADRDFVPVAEFLQTRGIKVIHGAFKPTGAVLMQKCWGSIDIPKIKEQFQRS